MTLPTLTELRAAAAASYAYRSRAGQVITEAEYAAMPVETEAQRKAKARFSWRPDPKVVDALVAAEKAWVPVTVTCAVIAGRLEYLPVTPDPGYTIVVACASCGSRVESVTTGRVIAGTEVSAIARCAECRREWHVRVLLQQVPGRRVEPVSGDLVGVG